MPPRIKPEHLDIPPDYQTATSAQRRLSTFRPSARLTTAEHHSRSEARMPMQTAQKIQM
jgi:hypothetical protein